MTNGTGLVYQRENGSYVERYAGRVIFPWHNISSRVIAFGARVLDSRSNGIVKKYVNSSDSCIYTKGKELYGLFQAKRSIAEERRLFYVAMTRAKKRMYVLYDQQRPSPFIGEFLMKLEIGSYLCPKCLEGKIVSVKDGTSTNGVPYRSFYCTNNQAGCDFFETRFGDLTPPGILVSEEMTVQDIEKIRNFRRKKYL